MLKKVAVVGIIVILAIQILFSIKANSITTDEYAHHIPAGYSYLKTGDFRLEPGSPSLTRLISAVPLAMIGTKLPIPWYGGYINAYAYDFWGHNDIDKTTFYARLPFLFISLLFGYFLFSWVNKLWGFTAGLVALVLYSFCPDILAHSSLATADLTLAFFFFLTVIRYYSYLNKPSLVKAVLIGVFAGLTMLSKYSGIILFPILFLITFFAGRKVKLQCRIILLFSVLTIWVGYGFECKPLLKNTPQPDKKEVIYRKFGLEKFAKEVPVPCSTYISGFTSMMFNRDKGSRSFFMGKWSDNGGFKAYYLVAFLIKNTLAMIFMFFIGIFCLWRFKLSRLLTLTLLAPITLFFLLTINDNAQAGIRYFLPIYPFVIAIASYGASKINWAQALLMYHVIVSLIISPYYLTYFNFIAQPFPEKWLKDSNIDWGQGLVGLKGMKDIVLSYPYPVPPEYYGITYRKPNESEYEFPGYEIYAISIHTIDDFKWAYDYKPTHIINRCIYVYDFKNPPIKFRYDKEGQPIYSDENGDFSLKYYGKKS